MKIVTTTEIPEHFFGIEKAIELIADAGFDGIDYADSYLKSFVDQDNYLEKAKELNKLANEKGVMFRQAHAPMIRELLKNGEWDYAIERTRKSMEAASVLGAKNVVVHPFQKGSYIIDSEILFEQNIKFFRALIPFCQEYDVKVAIENMVWVDSRGRRCDGVCAVPQEFKRYIETLDSPYITGCLDFGHLTLCQKEPQDVLRYLGKDIVTCLHVHDNDYFSDKHTLP